MPYTDIAKLTSCTTCHFAEDLSNYWTANLYFRARNGSYKRVPQMANQFNPGDNGGITLYYTSPDANVTTAFKPVRILFDSSMPCLNCVGLSHAHWGCHATHVREPWEANAAMLSLLHPARFWRQPVLAVYGSQVRHRSSAAAALCGWYKVKHNLPAVSSTHRRKLEYVGD